MFPTASRNAEHFQERLQTTTSSDNQFVEPHVFETIFRDIFLIDLGLKNGASLKIVFVVVTFPG